MGESLKKHCSIVLLIVGKKKKKTSGGVFNLAFPHRNYIDFTFRPIAQDSRAIVDPR